MYIDYEALRRNAVENQLRPNGVTDKAVLDAVGTVRRELFVGKAPKCSAYADEIIYCDEERRRFLIPPVIFAKMMQAAEITPGDIILDIGCGTGYAAAVMGISGNTVYAADTDSEYLRQTVRNCRYEGVTCITPENVAVLTDGLPENAPFDVITVFAALPEIPYNLCNQLSDGGRLVCIAQDNPQCGEAIRITRKGNYFMPESLFNCTAPYLESRQNRTFSL